MNLYLWVKALHVVSIIAFMAGVLYLPRLFVYHCAAEPGSVQAQTFSIMERRLLRLIINPALILAVLSGAWLAWSGGFLTAGWLHGKLVLVAVLLAVHGMLARSVRMFATGRNTRSARFYRILNEVPTLAMIGIVVLAVVKPF
jgi:putative membrane protein